MFKITLEIIRDRSGKCTLPANHSLIYDDSSEKVSVHGPGEGNVWTITALIKGRPVVKINNDQAGETAGEITVIVPNTPPQLTALGPVVVTRDSDDAVVGLILNHTAPDPFAYITNILNPGESFKDVDIDDDPDGDDPDGVQGSFRFKVLDKPDGVVIDTDRGYVAVRVGSTGVFNSDLTNGPIDMRAVILKNPNPDATPPDDTFDILLHAYDRDNDVSDNPVTLRFLAQEPQAGSYDVAQDDKGNFVYSAGKRALRIGNRLDVYHTVTVAGTGDSTVFGFKFAELAADALSKGSDGKGRLSEPLMHDSNTVICSDNKKPDDWKVYNDLGSHCYTVSGTNGVQFAAYDDMDDRPLDNLDDTPKIKFKLDSEKRRLTDTSGPKITITHHVYALRSEHDFSGTPGELDDLTRKIYSEPEVLSLDIHRCVETSDCP